MAGTRFYTESGTLYHIDYEDDRRWLTRFSPPAVGFDMRRDGEAIEILDCSSIKVGEVMTFVLDLHQDGETVTIRTTSPVTRYWTSAEEVSEA